MHADAAFYIPLSKEYLVVPTIRRYHWIETRHCYLKCKMYVVRLRLSQTSK